MDHLLNLVESIAHADHLSAEAENARNAAGEIPTDDALPKVDAPLSVAETLDHIQEKINHIIEILWGNEKHLCTIANQIYLVDKLHMAILKEANCYRTQKVHDVESAIFIIGTARTLEIIHNFQDKIIQVHEAAKAGNQKTKKIRLSAYLEQ